MYNGDVEQLQLRLAGTIIEFDGRPVQVSRVNQNGSLELILLPGGRDNIVVPSNDPRFNIRDFKLGYVNCHNTAGYLTRVPARQQRQGLTNANTVFDEDFRRFVGRPLSEISRRPEFTDMWRNTYPKFADVVNRLNANPDLRKMAFSRRFALSKDRELGFFELHYRGRRVAWGDPNQFNLPSEYQYLTEVISSEGVSVR